MQGDKQVIEEVRGLLRQALVALTLRGQDHLRSLLADLLQHLVRALGQEARRVGVSGRRLGAGRDHPRPLLEHPRRGGRVLPEAGPRSRVTRGSFRLHDVEQRILVAIGPDLDHAEPVSGGLPLLPKGLPAPAPEVREPRFRGAHQRRHVGGGHHENDAASAVLGHHRDQSRRVEGEPVRDGHLHGAPPSGGRTSIPLRRSSAFASAMRISPKWKIDAARAALALPSRSTSAMWATRPQPPEATTGMVTASATARARATSNPSLVPSRSMLVTGTSPAPRSIPSLAQATASRPVGVRPPWTYTSQAPTPCARASTARTTAWAPKRRESYSRSP